MVQSVPEVENDDTLRNSIPPTVDQHLVNRRSAAGERGGGVGRNDFDVPAVKLARFRNLYGCHVMPRNTTFGGLQWPTLIDELVKACGFAY